MLTVFVSVVLLARVSLPVSPSCPATIRPPQALSRPRCQRRAARSSKCQHPFLRASSRLRGYSSLFSFSDWPGWFTWEREENRSRSASVDWVCRLRCLRHGREKGTNLISILFSALGATLLANAKNENSRAVGAVVLGVGLNHSLHAWIDGRKPTDSRGTS